MGSDSDTRDIIKAVSETREQMVREMAGDMPSYGAPPPPVDPLAVPPEVVDECFNLDYEGDARLLVRLFKNRYLRDNHVGGRERDKFKGIYLFNGRAWEADTANQYLRDFPITLNDVYRLRAEMFFTELIEKFHPHWLNPPDSDDGGRGRSPGLGELIVRARHWLKDQGREAPPAEVDLLKKADAYLARGKKCLSPARVYHAAHSAFSGRDSLGFTGEWNDHPTMLPCRNGTVDLITGILMEPRPEHYFNRCLDWDYKGLNAPCPAWREAVEQIFYDPAIIDYVEHFCGVSATGFQSKDFFIFFGPRADNGKSLFFGALSRLLGPFCDAPDVDLLLRQSHRSSSVAHPEMLRLRHIRLVIFQEADNLDTFDSGKVKQITSGGDEVTARTLHSEIYYKYCQIYTSVLHTNKTPRIYGADRGLAGRIRVIPCESEFVDPAQKTVDPANRIFQARDRAEMRRLLDEEMSGILGWLVGCAMKFLANGRRMPPPPPEVAEESKEIMLEGDIVSQFLMARAIWGKDFEIRGRVLHHCFRLWCENDREMRAKDIMNEHIFGREMKSHAKKKRDKDGVIYLGLTVDSPEPVKPSHEDLDYFMGR